MLFPLIANINESEQEDFRSLLKEILAEFAKDVDVEELLTEADRLYQEEAERTKNKSDEKLRLINVSGLPASGKSYEVDRLKKLHPDFFQVGCDFIMEKLTRYISESKQDLKKAFDRWERPARVICYYWLERAVKEKKNILFEHSNSIEQHIGLYEVLKFVYHYEIEINFINATPEVVIPRLAGRGRHFTADRVLERWGVIQRLLPAYRVIANRFTEIKAWEGGMKMKRLIVVRHGNTFRPEETPLRVGCRTDLPLVEEERALNAGRILKEMGLIPDRVFAAPLKRTMETAELILRAMALSLPVKPLDVFSEIDYGEDEAKTEDEVMGRLGRVYLEREGNLAGSSEDAIRARGKQAINAWNSKAEPPAGWLVDPSAVVRNWKDFADEIKDGETVLVVSSNGIIRFVPHLLPPEDYERFILENNLKVTTGGTCVLECRNGVWEVKDWNIKPKLT